MFRQILITTAFALAAVASHASSTRLGYDPQADPFSQYHDAIAQAKSQNKLVLVIAGGDWCSWCHKLDRFISRDTQIDTAVHDTFVVVKVYIGDENYNELFFSQLPPARGAPHFWVISPQQQVLRSQSTAVFEQGHNGYDKAAFMNFTREWAHVDARTAAN